MATGKSNGYLHGLDGARVLVTGGTRGIGEAMARQAAAVGAKVLVAARTAVERPEDHHFVAADLSTIEGAATVAKAALELWGGVDVLVNNAGGHTPVPGGALKMAEKNWTADLSLNLLAAVRLDRALLPTMIARGSGVIIHVGSGAAKLPQSDGLAYAAAKAALTTYSKGLANEVSAKGHPCQHGCARIHRDGSRRGLPSDAGGSQPHRYRGGSATDHRQHRYPHG